MADQEFNNKFGGYYGNYRSEATHGRLHVTDYSKLRDASIANEEVKKWAWLVIRDFISKGQTRLS